MSELTRLVSVGYLAALARVAGSTVPGLLATVLELFAAMVQVAVQRLALPMGYVS